MFWALMMLAFLRFDGDLGAIGLDRGTVGTVRVLDGMGPIPPMSPSSFQAMDGMGPIPPMR